MKNKLISKNIREDKNGTQWLLTFTEGIVLPVDEDSFKKFKVGFYYQILIEDGEGD